MRDALRDASSTRDSDGFQRTRIENLRPPKWHNPKPASRYDVIVIGGGPAGSVAAIEAAAAAAKVALIERDLLGGGCLNVADIPSKALIRTARLYADMRHAEHFGARAPAGIRVDFALAMERMRRIRARVSRVDSAKSLRAKGIDVFFGDARFVAADAVSVDGVRLRFHKAVVATGARPDTPSVPGLAEAGYLTSDNVFDLTELPASLLVIGGGPLGCELAQMFCRLGARTTIAQDAPLFLPKEERDAAQLLSEHFARDGIEVRLNTTAAGVREENGQKIVELMSDGFSTTVTVDAVLTGTGRLPNVENLNLDVAGIAFEPVTGIAVDDFLRTTNANVYAAGDVCLEHKFTHTADASARIAVHNALSRRRQRMSALTVPWCTYTDPEIAHVGLYVREARDRDIPVKTFTVPIHDVHRAITDSEEVGFAKLHVREGTDKLLGATIVARHASDMINEITLALVANVGLKTLARVLHAYPTQSVAIKKAADAYVATLAKRNVSTRAAARKESRWNSA
jgi:pyruvate/2-oxoglutarate dehydrogenase complex dihydrolipoamide dehydrogenase (E3) component